MGTASYHFEKVELGWIERVEMIACLEVGEKVESCRRRGRQAGRTLAAHGAKVATRRVPKSGDEWGKVRARWERNATDSQSRRSPKSKHSGGSEMKRGVEETLSRAPN